MAYAAMAIAIQSIVSLTDCQGIENGFHLGLRLWLLAFTFTMIHYAHNYRGNRMVVLVDLSYQLALVLSLTCSMAYSNGLGDTDPLKKLVKSIL